MMCAIFLKENHAKHLSSINGQSFVVFEQNFASNTLHELRALGISENVNVMCIKLVPLSY